MAYTKYSLTPADNNAAPPNGAPEGMLPSAVNDTMRDMMAQIRDVGDGIRGGTYTMTAPVITGGSITGVALSGNTLTNPVITGGSINNTPIGASTANTGAFTTLGASGVATFSAGTVSAPAITTTGDTNTGIFFPAADTIAFTEGGVEAMRITSTGIVDIGGSSGGSVGELLVVEGANSAGHRAARINNTGTTNGYSTLWMGSSNDGLIRGGSTAGSFTDQLLLLTSGSIPISFYTANTERMRITSAGNVGIGTSSPSYKLDVIGQASRLGSGSTGSVFGLVNNTGGNLFFGLDQSTGGGLAGGSSAYAGVLSHTGAYSLQFGTNNTIRATIDSSGNVGIGTSSPAAKLDVDQTTVGLIARFRASDSSGRQLTITSSTTSNTGDTYTLNSTGGSGVLAFATSNTERMRIDSSGNVFIAKTGQSSSTVGIELLAAGQYVGSRNGLLALYNRLTTDGDLISFRQDGNEEGTISVSGTTVSYNGGHLARWSQLPDNSKDDTILKGTVLTNLDDMCVWTKDGTVLDNEQLNKMKVSDVEGDTNVAGVFVNWTRDEDCNSDDMNIAMTGDMIIRIADGVVVQKGDLLMSAGDGTAKPQGDDIVRSKTIAKVTSNYVTCTYADGSYCVPCVLMAC